MPYRSSLGSKMLWFTVSNVFFRSMNIPTASLCLCNWCFRRIFLLMPLMLISMSGIHIDCRSKAYFLQWNHEVFLQRVFQRFLRIGRVKKQACNLWNGVYPNFYMMVLLLLISFCMEMNLMKKQVTDVS